MIESSGDGYQSTKFAKALCASDSKVGKSCFLIASALGVLPWQKQGGVVDKPENLHVLTFDANALGGVKRFLKDTCGASDEALNFRVYNLQDDMRSVSASQTAYDMDFYNAIMASLVKIQERARGSAVVHFSSLTGLAAGLERGISGPPEGRGQGMDIAKWGTFAHQLNEIRNYGQLDKWHCFWEAHIHKPKQITQDKDAPPAQETLQISGKTGQNFSYNVEQVFRIRRQFGQVYKETKCDQVYLDTRASLDFLASGRNFTEALEAKEYCMTSAFKKLGLTVGHWGAKSAAPKPVAKATK